MCFALIGIVAMQLVVLRFNTQIGKGLERKANLQREISSLQVATSALSAGERVQQLAARRGMQAGAPGSVQFVGAQTSDAAAAAQLLASASAASGEAGASEQAAAIGAAGQEAPHG